MKYAYSNNDFRGSLKVPDGSRNIFAPNHATSEGLRLLIIELDSIYQDLLDDLKLSGSGIDKEIIA